ncbi:tyrosine-type recombinase/integrase [Nitrosarchaeum koreense]|uniref:Integrase family protein n=1 Tax=Nitrosarchaeum koreense MY1 TaxID=1001994 RepID=F9CZ69_9ARCH|nr:tyrosine-type recombinase/integrase [Nitrosarchaeum koreense]EGP94227.1 Integrase family protein [Nitrosarchaeum koreense MY1]
MPKLQPEKPTSDIYSYDIQIQGIFRRIENDLPKNTVELIHKYDRVMINTSKAKGTRRKHLQTLYILSKLVEKEWSQVTKDDIDILVSKIMEQFAESNGQESNYSYDHKKVLKIFFRWFKLGSRELNDVGDPEETKKVKLGKIRDKIVREDLITDEDREKLLLGCSGSLRDRALIDVQCEAGTRPGELLTLKIKHVKFDEYGAIIHVDGKTGARPVRLIRSTPNLSLWMDSHPLKESPNAPLWINMSKRDFGKQLSAASARQIVKKVCEKTKISKRIYLNLFRHSEATNSARFLTEAQLKKRHGWSSVSRMPARYVHLVDADVDEAILRHNGIVTKDKEITNMPKICHICKRSCRIDCKIRVNQKTSHIASYV